MLAERTCIREEQETRRVNCAFAYFVAIVRRIQNPGTLGMQDFSADRLSHWKCAFPFNPAQDNISFRMRLSHPQS